KDFTIVKFMFTAILVGMTGIYLLSDLGIINVAGRSFILGGTLVGGALFGIGWALIGYCPGTGWAAIGEGRIDAIFGLLGVFFGGFIYSEIYPFMRDTVLTWGDLGNPTLPELFGVNHWIVIGILIVAVVGMFRMLEKYDL
ncbi:MAG TPA: YeeE/YedE family protein, partial [Eubacteriaceae bacterium]|nr:YeeE/YedE family protein [Eubacteriaceae bacterium]